MTTLKINNENNITIIIIIIKMIIIITTFIIKTINCWFFSYFLRFEKLIDLFKQ